MQEIMCSLCAGSAEMVIVDGLTYTICGNCANIHIAETNQYIRFNVSNAEGMALVPRKLLTVALAMEAVYTVYDEIYREVKKKFNIDVPLSEWICDRLQNDLSRFESCMALQKVVLDKGVKAWYTLWVRKWATRKEY